MDAPNIIVPPTIGDLVVAEQILDYINPKDLFNYFTDTPEGERLKDPFQEFVQLCRTNLGFAARHLIGQGDFELLPFQTVILDTLWEKTFPVLLMTRGGGKTTMLAIYALLRAVLDQTSASGSKIVLIAASFRQSKLIMEKVEELWQMSPLLRACCENPDGVKRSNDKWELKLGNSSIVALPLGDGNRIRGVRATHILCDEYAAIPSEIFEIVIRGFAAVNANPVDKVRANYRRNKMIQMGINPDDVPEVEGGNQIVRSGTADFQFNHFYAVYEQYKRIIENKLVGGVDNPKVREILGQDINSDTYIDYKKYAVIQIPYQGLPKGYMDEAMINEASIRMSKDQFQMEYLAQFITDSQGFFKASAIASATPKPDEAGYFEIQIEPHSGATHVMGIDPARKSDDFALVILQVTDAGHRMVYAAKWNKKNFGEIAKEVRRLQKVFNVVRIGIDSGGGGTALIDFLQTPELMGPGDLPFFEIDSKDKAAGLKIINPVNYMGSWLKTANYELAADIEHRRLLFPYSAATSKVQWEVKAEEVFDLVLECKKQLMSIEITATDKTEIEHFDVPEDMKWKAKKDLYSALLIAAYEARQVKQKVVRTPVMDSKSIGGSLNEFA